MENSSSFFVTFSSDDCKDIFPDNSMSNFRVRLPRTLHLNSRWVVGLADVSFSNSRYTFDRPLKFAAVSANQTTRPEISSNETIVEVDWKETSESQGTTEVKMYLKPALFSTVKELIDAINTEIRNKVFYQELPQITLTNNIVEIEPGSITGVNKEIIPVTLTFDPVLRNLLGIDRWGIPSLNAKTNLLYLYCSVCKPRIVGDVSAKLLRTVDPSKGSSFGSIVSQTFRRIYYTEIDILDFSEIEIQLLQDTGHPPLFKFGRFRVTLHFKERGE